MKRFVLITVFLIASLVLIQTRGFRSVEVYEDPTGLEGVSSSASNSLNMDDKEGAFSFTDIQPSAPTQPTTAVVKRNYAPLARQIRTYLRDKQGLYAVSFISLTSNQRFGINENSSLIAASTTKVPINLYLFNRIVQKKVDPETMLEYSEEDYEEGTGSIQYEELGTLYSIRELSRRSIAESDNIAINMLVRYLGWDNIKKYMESVVKHPVDFENNSFSSKDMATFMKAVLDFSKKHKNAGEELLGYLENTAFNDRIPLYLPEGTIVAHKIGNQVQTVNDIGIVFADKPFIVSILSQEVNEEEACEVIGSITKMIYDFEEQ